MTSKNPRVNACKMDRYYWKCKLQILENWPTEVMGRWSCLRLNSRRCLDLNVRLETSFGTRYYTS